MGQDNAILQKAISQIDQECSYLSAEQAAFEEFRESVRLAPPEPTAIAGASETTEHLRETYGRDRTSRAVPRRVRWGAKRPQNVPRRTRRH